MTMKTMHPGTASIKYLIFSVLFALTVSSCGKSERCIVPIGMTNFKITPNSSFYPGLNNVGGYEYVHGGHLGVIIVRMSYDHFVAFERTCPVDSLSAVTISSDWSSALLECPTCHTCFIVAADGMPMDGGSTSCPLYQYNTTYSDGELYVY